jgi:uncharacterized repeat protein (TIGR02543 family)/LPXTG-motif cell wall-anchored protein
MKRTKKKAIAFMMTLTLILSMANSIFASTPGNTVPTDENEYSNVGEGETYNYNTSTGGSLSANISVELEGETYSASHDNLYNPGDTAHMTFVISHKAGYGDGADGMSAIKDLWFVVYIGDTILYETPNADTFNISPGKNSGDIDVDYTIPSDASGAITIRYKLEDWGKWGIWMHAVTKSGSIVLNVPSDPVDYTLTVKSTEGGSVVEAGSTDYPEGTVIDLDDLTYVEEPNYVFQGWNVVGGDYDETTKKITMTEDVTATAMFEYVEEIEYMLTVGSTTGGSVLEEGDEYYLAGTVIDLDDYTCVPEPGYEFTYWDVDGGVYNETTKEITMTGDAVAIAHFEISAPINYTLTVTSTEGGSAVDEGSTDYLAGTVIDLDDLSYVTDDGYIFAGWNINGGDYDSETNTVTMTSDVTVTAQFEFIESVEYTLTVTSTSGGSVEDEGSTMHPEGTVIDIDDLKYNESSGYKFTGWEVSGGEYNGTKNEVTMTSDVTITANFEKEEEKVYHLLTVSSTEGGSSTHEGSTYYAEGRTVSLNITEEGYEFVGWEGDTEAFDQASLTDSNEFNFQVVMDQDVTLRAIFKKIEEPVVNYTLTVSSTEGGSSNHEGTTVYPAGSVVDLDVTPDSDDYEFVGWEGDSGLLDSDTYEVVMNQDVTVRAVFNLKIIEEDIPEGNPEDNPFILDGDVPEGSQVPTEIPQTGGIPTEVFGLIGAMMGSLGIAIKKKNK